MRSLAEWLVVPLLLLPIAAGAGLALWAEKAVRLAEAPYERDGPETARAWLRGGGAASWMPRHVTAQAASLPSDLVSCTHPTASARLRVLCDALGTARWSFEADLPSPITPAMLIQPGVRLALETGSAPIDVDGASGGALALRALLTTPDLDALRLAPLPPATKRYVLRRWRQSGLDSPALEQADALLAAFGRYVDAVEQRGAPLPLGAHRLGDLDVLSFSAEAPALVVVGPVADPRLRHVLLEVSDEESPARLTWRFPPLEATADTVLWHGRLETPLAGTFTFHARWRGWWDTPWVKRWVGPVLALLLASLLLPVALLVSIRRRRLLDEARVRFINELAHDLRTPLASLQAPRRPAERGAREAGEARGLPAPPLARGRAALVAPGEPARPVAPGAGAAPPADRPGRRRRAGLPGRARARPAASRPRGGRAGGGTGDDLGARRPDGPLALPREPPRERGQVHGAGDADPGHLGPGRQ